MFDYLLKIEALGSKLRMWRAFFFLALGLLIAAVSQVDYSRLSSLSTIFSGGGYIARVSVEGAISHNRSRDALMEKIARDDAIKAVLLKIDSPGGTVGDSEVLYQQILDIASRKPVVAVMGNVAASGGYMIALAADHIIARNGTLTGSIGVRSSYIGISQVAQKLGITLRTIKTSEHKGAGSLLEEMSENAVKHLQAVVDDFHRHFISLVVARRNMNENDALEVSDGRVFTGSQAHNAGLIDAIGGEHEALAWLKENKDVDATKLAVRDLEYRHRIVNAEGLISMLYMAFTDFFQRSGM